MVFKDATLLLDMLAFFCVLKIDTLYCASMFFVMSSFTILQSFDHGYHYLIKSIQERRSEKEGLVTVGIGGPSGSGKTRYTCYL